MSNIIDDFRRAMSDAGIKYTGEIIADSGRVERFTPDDKRHGGNSAWYRLFTDGIPSGAFGDWSLGINETWCAKKASDMTDEEREQHRKKIEAIKKEREAEILEVQKKAAIKAEFIWNDAIEHFDTHPYLEKKGVKSHGLRVGKWQKWLDSEKAYLTIDECLLIPINDGKKIAGLQAIFPKQHEIFERDRDFLPGQKKNGCFFLIGKPDKERPKIIICEGYATGATIYEETGIPVVVAFDAGNLPAVAVRWRKALPAAHIIIAADNDQWGEKNIGVIKAGEAAQLANADFKVPNFDKFDPSKKPTDFNDLATLAGGEAVADYFLLREKTPAVKNDEAQTAIVVFDNNAVDWFAPLPDINSTAKPLSTIENMREIVDRLGISVRYNVIAKDVEILIPGCSFSLDNRANACLAWLVSACGRFRMPTDKVDAFLTYLADRNQYNPVADWITSRSWDGKSRLADFFGTVKTDGDEDLKNTLMRRWMISAVAAAFLPNGVSAHGVLVFQGDQYVGKTKWFKTLVPEPLGVIQDGLMLRPDDKDSVMQAVKNWLVELGELDSTFRKADIAQLKAFLTRDKDVLRRPYDRKESTFARRTVFFASVNPKAFLHDASGNRRYWTISVTGLDHSHTLDMQQVWAEVYETQFKAGEGWFLLPDEMARLNEQNQAHDTLDPIKERLQRDFDWDSDQEYWEWKTSTEIITSIGFDRPTRHDVTSCAGFVRELNGKQSKRGNRGSLLLIPQKLIKARD